ncbi:MAG: hypothetical protein MK108_05530 [Mariniblastus sp.]|nr:hypothetical protein [Mariniblastus sp.]
MTNLQSLSNPACRLLALALLAGSLLLVAGCGGCTEEDPQANAGKEEDKQEQAKENYEDRPSVVFPGNYYDEIRTNRTKLGHWVTADIRMIANNFDARGELLARPFNGRSNQPSTVWRTNYFPQSVRPASLPKEEWRNFQISLYLPKNPNLKNASVDFEFNSGTSGILQHATRLTRAAMHNFQQHLVVLTNRPDAYAYVTVLDSVVIPDLTYQSERFPPFYYVVRTRPSTDPIPLPREALNWTTIGYLIWDDLNPDQLDTDQQQSLIDWLHFGGQLILSGPDCLDKLQSSFLAEYLPASFEGTRNLTNEDLRELNEHWAIPVKNNPQQKHVLQVDEKSPLIGVDFKPHPEGKFVTHTGEIAIERQVGRGRVVVTSFSLDEAPVVAWPSYRSFFNGCLLRKPARQFGKTRSDTLSFKFLNDRTHILDPMLATTLRYTSRDLSNGEETHQLNFKQLAELGTQPPVSAGNNFAWNQDVTAETMETGFNLVGQPATNKQRRIEDSWHYGGYQHDLQAGNAGWNDQSGISNAARETLVESAGITPPSSKFVFQMLAIYLLVLVPLNWLVFRLMGRVEWAWVAAPLIAIAGAFAVARMASLDIGFVRSNTQVGLLEVYQGHPRGHLSQYSALYTSLSTGYELDLDNASAQSLPFGLSAEKFRRKEGASSVTMHKTLANRLENFQVQSNTTGLLHTEMMLDLGGSFRYDDRSSGTRLENNSQVSLQQAAIYRRLPDSTLEFAWVGDLPEGDIQEDLQFQPLFAPSATATLGSLICPEDPKSVARRIWTEVAQRQGLPAFDENTRLSIEPFLDVAEIEPRREAFQVASENRLANPLEPLEPLEPGGNGPADLSVPRSLDYPTFESVFTELFPATKIHVSRLLDAVLENLPVAPGETRLLGSTRQTLGNNRFDPVSTQTDQETLVLVHLKRPPLLDARPDSNLLSDFGAVRSSLDWENELDELDELDGQGESDQPVDQE